MQRRCRTQSLGFGGFLDGFLCDAKSVGDAGRPWEAHPRDIGRFFRPLVSTSSTVEPGLGDVISCYFFGEILAVLHNDISQGLQGTWT